jgi:hypothetical protein
MSHLEALWDNNISMAAWRKLYIFQDLCYLQWSIKKQNLALKVDDSIRNRAIVDLEGM